MEMYDRIEKTRFLGHEFLVWIWWKSELFEGTFDIGEFQGCEVWIDDQLTLELRGVNVEQSALKGGSPSATPEAKEALRQGKVPTKARLSISREEREFGFVLDSETFGLSGVRTPALLQDNKDERFYERMYLLEELEEVLHALYREFLLLRISKAWETSIAPAIRAWVRDEPEMDRKSYLKLLSEVLEK